MSSTMAEGELSTPLTPDTSFTATEATTAMTSPFASPHSSPKMAKHGSPETSPRSSKGATTELSALRAQLEAATEAQAKVETRAHVLEAELSRFKDQHAFVTAAKEALEKQLREERTRREAAEEKIEILRGQVEAARRGVMQLQKQEQDRVHRSSRQMDVGGDEEAAEARKAKRSSMYGLGLSTKASRPVSTISNGESAEPPIPAKSGLRELRLGSNAGGNGRRQSMTLKVAPVPSPAAPGSPLTPRGVQSVPKSPSRTISPPRRADVFNESEEDSPVLGECLSAKQGSRRASAVSGISGSGVSAISAISGDPSEHLEKLKAARMETEVLKTQVEALEAKLMEADEARQASDQCLAALREFIAADPNAGNDGDEASRISLPPLPTDKDHDEPAPVPEPKAGWGFNMWRRESVSQPGAASPAAKTGALPLSPPVAPTPASPSISVSPPPLQALLRSPDLDEKEVKKDDKPITSGFFSSWTKAPPPEPEPEPETEPEPVGANLGRKMTSFFGRKARMGSRAAERAAQEKAEREEALSLPEDDAPHAAAIAAAMGEVTSPTIDLESKPAPEPIAVPDLPDNIATLSTSPLPEPVAAPVATPIAEPKPDPEVTVSKVSPKATPKMLSPEPRLAYLDDEPEPKPTAPTKPKRSPSRKTSPAPIVTATESLRPTDAKPRISLDDPPKSLSITPVRRGSLPSSVSPVFSRSPLSAHSLSVPPSPGLSSPGTPVRGSSLGGAAASPYDGEEVEEVQSEPEDNEEGKPVRPQRRNASRRGRGTSPTVRKASRGGFV